MFCMEQSSRPPSLKLPLMDDIAKFLQNQDTAVKPGPSSSTSLDIGQFLSNPPNRGNWYPVAREKFEQRQQVVPQAFSNIARPGYKGLPTASINQRELVKLELMVRECIATSNFLSALSTASESTLNNLRAARDQSEKTFTLLASEPDPNNRDQFLQQLLNSTIEDTRQMQFMLDISRSTAVAYQHLLEKFLHLLTNLVLIRRDAYLKNAHNSLDSYCLKNLRAAPISGPDLFERSLMQEYEQHVIGLGIKTGNQQSTRFHPYGKHKKKPRGREAYQQGGFYPDTPPQYIMPPHFSPQQQPQRGGFRGGNRGRGSCRGRGMNKQGTYIYPRKHKRPPSGGRLKWFINQWEQQGAHPFHLDILKQGYRLPFRDHPKLSRTPCIHSGNSEIDKDNALSTSILDLLAKNAIEKVNKHDSLGFYSQLFLLPKPGNKWRPVIDLSSLNQYPTVSKFKMETPESICTSLRQGEWVTSIDLSDTYLLIPIHPQSRKFLRFHHKETLYQFTSLSFGLATAPLVLTSLVNEVKLLALKQDIHLHQ